MHISLVKIYSSWKNGAHFQPGNPVISQKPHGVDFHVVKFFSANVDFVGANFQATSRTAALCPTEPTSEPSEPAWPRLQYLINMD